MSTRDALLAAIEAFLKETGMGPTYFGKKCCNDPHLVARLRRGGDVGTKKLDQAREFIAKKLKR